MENSCPRTAECLLQESPLLKEFAYGVKKGWSYPYKIHNKNLEQHLNVNYDAEALSWCLDQSSTLPDVSALDSSAIETLNSTMTKEGIRSSIKDTLDETDLISKITHSVNENVNKNMKEKLDASFKEFKESLQQKQGFQTPM